MNKIKLESNELFTEKYKVLNLFPLYQNLSESAAIQILTWKFFSK